MLFADTGDLGIITLDAGSPCECSRFLRSCGVIAHDGAAAAAAADNSAIVAWGVAWHGECVGWDGLMFYCLLLGEQINSMGKVAACVFQWYIWPSTNNRYKYAELGKTNDN